MEKEKGVGFAGPGTRHPVRDMLVLSPVVIRGEIHNCHSCGRGPWETPQAVTELVGLGLPVGALGEVVDSIIS